MPNHEVLQESAGDADFISEVAANAGRTLALSVLSLINSNPLSSEMAKRGSDIANDCLRSITARLTKRSVPEHLITLYRDRYQREYHSVLLDGLCGDIAK